jgi:hypothetical protein
LVIHVFLYTELIICHKKEQTIITYSGSQIPMFKASETYPLNIYCCVMNESLHIVWFLIFSLYQSIYAYIFTCRVNVIKIFIYYFRENFLEKAAAMPYIEVPNGMYAFSFVPRSSNELHDGQ